MNERKRPASPPIWRIAPLTRVYVGTRVSRCHPGYMCACVLYVLAFEVEMGSARAFYVKRKVEDACDERCDEACMRSSLPATVYVNAPVVHRPWRRL